MVRRKIAFTLTEVIGILVMLAAIALITTPIIDAIISNSRQAAYDRTVDSIIEAAKNYSTLEDLGESTEEKILFLSTLKEYGLLEQAIINPVNDQEMNGCVWYKWNPEFNQYDFEYDNTCDITDPTINITYNEQLINSKGWAKENIGVTFVGNGEIRYCISNEECEPTELIQNNSNTKFVVNEGTTYLCGYTENPLGKSETLCKSIKLDKTPPVINGVEPITVDRFAEVDLNKGITISDNPSGSGLAGAYTVEPNTVDTSTAGTKTVTYTVSDNADNVTTVNRTITVQGEPPVVEFTVQGNPFNSNNWSKENVSIKIDVTDNSGLGIKEIKYCKGTIDCEPTTNIENGGIVILEESSATNKVCIEAIDNNNTSSKICSDNYQIDKVLPIIDGVGDLTVSRNETVNLTNGVTYSDTLSQIDGELTVTPSSIDTSTIGTKQVVYSISDKAGNVREVTRNIIIDAEAPTIVFSLVNSSAINSNGWAKSDFYVRATITDNSGTGIQSGMSCTTNSSSECTPVASFTGTTKDFLISVEGSNRACVQVTDNNNKTTKVCSDTYKLDKTAPVAGTATFTGTLGSDNWYRSNVTVNVSNGSDSLSGHNSTTSNISSVTSNTSGKTVTITTTDLAGNSSTRSYTIKVDKTDPNSFTISASGISSTGFTVSGTTTDGLSGIANYKLYLNGSYRSSNTTGRFTLTGLSSSGTYTAYIVATDKAGNTRTSNTISQKLVYVTSLSLNTNSVTKQFKVNSSFNYSGLKVTANKSDGTSQTVTGYTVSSPSMSSAGTKTVTVSYSGVSSTYTIQVGYIWKKYNAILSYRYDYDQGSRRRVSISRVDTISIADYNSFSSRDGEFDYWFMSVTDDWDYRARCRSGSGNGCTDLIGDKYDEGDRMPELWVQIDDYIYYETDVVIRTDDGDVYLVDSLNSSSFYGYLLDVYEYVYSASKGSTYYGTVFSTSSNAYPSNSYSGNYWYVRQ